MSTESAHLSTFCAETETEAEIRSTSIRNSLRDVTFGYFVWVCLFWGSVTIISARKQAKTAKVNFHKDTVSSTNRYYTMQLNEKCKNSLVSTDDYRSDQAALTKCQRNCQYSMDPVWELGAFRYEKVRVCRGPPSGGAGWGGVDV